MINLFQPVFEALMFIFAILLAFYLPGKYLVRRLKLKLNFLEDKFFNISLGLVIFTLIAYVLSWLNLSFILPFILLLVAFFVFGEKGKSEIYDKKDTPYLIVLSLMALVFSLTMITSGEFGETLRLVKVNAQDSMWHLSLVNELKAHFPPDNPGFAGVPLIGYHFFFNLLLANFSQVFSISAISLYFHFFPLLISFLWVLGVYLLMLKWTSNRGIAVLSVFFTLFGGSFSFILRFIGDTNLSLDDAFGITQPASALLNPPFSISVVLIIASLFCLLRYFKEKKDIWLVPLVILAGMVTMFKVYAGIIILGGLGFIAFWQALRRNHIPLIAFISSLFLFFVTYWIFKDPTSKLFFAPLWSPHRVVEAAFPAFGFAEKLETYTKQEVLRGLVTIEVFAFTAFLLGSLGTRIIGLFYLIPVIFKNKLKLSPFISSFIFMMLVSFIIPLFFIQSGKAFEIIQMTWYFLLFVSLVASIGIYRLLMNFRSVRGFLLVLILVFTLPSAYEKINAYTLGNAEIISKSYIEATNFLKNQGNYNSTVLELPPSEYYIGPNTAREDIQGWYLNLSSPRLLAFSNKRGYVNNQFINFSGVDAYARLELILSMVKLEEYPSNQDPFYLSEIKEKFKKDKIVYIFSPRPLLRLEKNNIIEEIFQNESAIIYKVL